MTDTQPTTNESLKEKTLVEQLNEGKFEDEYEIKYWAKENKLDYELVHSNISDYDQGMVYYNYTAKIGETYVSFCTASNSWDEGYDEEGFLEFAEVKPVEKLVIVYEAV